MRDSATMRRVLVIPCPRLIAVLALCLAACGDSDGSTGGGGGASSSGGAGGGAETGGAGGLGGDADGGGPLGGGDACGGVSLSGAEDIVGTTFVHDDPDFPKPQIIADKTTVTIVWRDVEPSDPDAARELRVTFNAMNVLELRALTLTTQEPGYEEFSLEDCAAPCSAQDNGVTRDPGSTGDMGCIRFDNTVVARLNPNTGTYDTPVAINGALAY